jgi:hypothetical protein
MAPPSYCHRWYVLVPKAQEQYRSDAKTPAHARAASRATRSRDGDCSRARKTRVTRVIRPRQWGPYGTWEVEEVGCAAKGNQPFAGWSSAVVLQGGAMMGGRESP